MTSCRLRASTLVLILAAGCTRSEEDAETAEIRAGSREGAARSDSPPFVIYPLAPVPAGLRSRQGRILSLRESGKMTEMLDEYPSFLEGLRTAWGERSERLTSHHYNYCLALKVTGRLRECLEETASGLKLWPESLQHRVLDATLRMNLSAANGRVLPGTEDAVSRVLRPANYTALRKIRIHPSDLHLQWASILYLVGRLKEALGETDRSIELRPGFSKAAALKARTLVKLRRSVEAIPLLEGLRKTAPSADVALLLGTAYLSDGRAADAWSVMEKHLEAEASSGRRPDGASETLAGLRTACGAALNRLGRFSEARSVLLDHLVESPEDDTALRRMGSALRGLKLESAARVAVARAGELAGHMYHLSENRKSLSRGLVPSAWYHQAQAYLAVDRVGDASQAIDRALRRFPSSLPLRLLRIECFLQMGRLRQALEETAAAIGRVGSAAPVLRAVQARLLARSGETRTAREILSKSERIVPEDRRARSLMAAYRARAFLELGELGEVRGFVESLARSEETGSSSAAQDVALLCRAALHLETGEIREAATLLRQEISVLEGGVFLAGGLRILADVAGPPAAAEAGSVGDLSDLVDQPWLIARARSFPGIWSSERGQPILSAAADIVGKRDVLLGQLEGAADREKLRIWGQLIEFYLQSGALRKGREAAWYLYSRNPGGIDESLFVARALSRREEAFSRLSIVERGLARFSGNTELLRMRDAVREFLGVSP